jgi:hypothetical protein
MEKVHAISVNIRKAICGVKNPRYWSSERSLDKIDCSNCIKRLSLSEETEQLEFTLEERKNP